MRNALLISFGVLVLAVVGFAGTAPEMSVVVSDDAVPREDHASESQNAIRIGVTPALAQVGQEARVPDHSTQIDATLCQATSTSGSSSGGPDECEECQLDCMKEWQECRRHCAKPKDWGHCVESCTDELEWCQTSGCSGVCDSSASHLVAKGRERL